MFLQAKLGIGLHPVPYSDFRPDPFQINMDPNSAAILCGSGSDTIEQSDSDDSERRFNIFYIRETYLYVIHFLQYSGHYRSS